LWIERLHLLRLSISLHITLDNLIDFPSNADWFNDGSKALPTDF